VIIPTASAYMAAEYFVLLFLNRKAILRAAFVSPLWFWSFGHQAIDPHMLKMLILLSDYQNFNPYVVGTFEQYVDICYLRHSSLMCMLRPLVKWSALKKKKIAVLSAFLRMMGGNATIVPEYHEHHASAVEGVFITERIRLFQKTADMPIVPLAEPIERCKKLLEEAHPHLAGKWFVSLYLRKTDKVGDEMRDTDPTTFRSIIERVHALEGFVFLGGDYHDPREIFPNLPGVLGYADVPCERALADYYGITQCRFLVGPTSGPVSIAMSFNIPNLMTNDPFYYHSGNRENQIVLYKKLREVTTGRILSAQETFSFPIVAYRMREEFERDGYVHVDNSPKEITEACEEMIQRFIVQNEVIQPQDRLLLERFRNLLPKESVAAITPSRPALTYLRNLLW
jgi:putative glycosyltransferase (TIGR04372 family)